MMLLPLFFASADYMVVAARRTVAAGAAAVLRKTAVGGVAKSRARGGAGSITGGKCSRQGEVGRGVAGVVYKTCCSGRCSYVTKVFKSAREFARARNEIQLQALVAMAGLAPKVHRAGCTPSECFLIMDRVDMTLGQYIARRGALTPHEQRAVIKLLERVAALGVDHGDVHSGNIAVDQGFRLRMIDFSESSRAAAVAVGPQVAKLVGDLGVLFPRLRFEVFESVARAAVQKQQPASACAKEEDFLALVARETGLDVRNPDVEDAVLDIWMDGPSDCAALLRRVRRRFKLG